MPMFRPEYDDLNSFFYVCFVEEYESRSADNDLNTLKHLKSILGKTDWFIDWCIEQMDLSCEYKISKNLCQAILNTIDIDGLMAKLNDWVDNKTCDTCVREMTYCECEEQKDEENECADCYEEIDEDTGFHCGFCTIKYCDDCIADIRKNKEWTETSICPVCYNSETPPTTQADQADSKNVQDHSHLLETDLTTLVISPA